MERGIRVSAGGTFEMNGGEIHGNAATGTGAGVWVSGAGSTFTMNAGEIHSHNAVGVTNGVINIANGSATMNGGKIHGNSTNGNGGAVTIQVNGTFTMNAGEIVSNTATLGAGVFANAGVFHMNGGRIADNTATGNGGGVNVGVATLEINGGQIVDNNATRGGGVFVNGGTVIMRGGAISGNTAINDAGGIRVGPANGTFTMEGGQISGNIAGTNGGGIVLEPLGVVAITDGVISGNTGNNGGGLFVAHSNGFIPNLTIGSDAVFTGNIARNGRFVNDTAATNNSQVEPGTVSVPAHAFSNSDINATGILVHLVTFAVRNGVGGTITGDGAAVQGSEIGKMVVEDGDVVDNPTASPFVDFHTLGWYVNDGARLVALGDIIADGDIHIEVLFGENEPPYVPVPPDNNGEVEGTEPGMPEEEEQGMAGGVVQTGDTTNVFVYIVLIVISGVVIFVYIKRYNRKGKRIK
ncbi:MAG: hypothetical protein FWC79_08780 [Oscillospiraceae bacterium]|nr:hypothetical protein [Oscillospiraceae bacterium]